MRRRNKILASVVVLMAAGILTAELAGLPVLRGKRAAPAVPAGPVMPIAAAPAAAEDSASVGSVAPAPGQRSAMMQEINQALAAEKATVAALQSQSELATDHQQALATQREVERVKQETELRILAIQADHARGDGRTEQAAEIEQAIQTITNPPAPPAPSPRRARAGRIGR